MKTVNNVRYTLYWNEEEGAWSILYGRYRRESMEYATGIIIDRDSGQAIKFWLVEENENLEFACRIFAEQGMGMLPCGFSIIFFHAEDKEKIKRNLWSVLRTFKDKNCFFWTGEMLLDVAYDPTTYDH